MKAVKKFISDVAANTVATMVISIITGLGGPIAIIWASLKEIIITAGGRSVPVCYWIIFSLGVSVAIVGIVLNIAYWIRRVNHPVFPKIQSDVRYTSAVSELFFRNRESIECTRDVKFEVVCDKMESIKKQFNWTGTEYKKTEIEKAKGIYTLIDSQRKYPPHGYEIKFDGPKMRGSEIWFKTRSEVEDTNHDMKPFFSHTVKSPTDVLELRVTAPKGMLKNVTYTVFADSMAEIPISKPITISAKDIGNLETFSYHIEKPNLLYNYRLDWNF